MKSKKTAAKKSIIASRRRCKAGGTGLSHYILPERKAAK